MFHYFLLLFYRSFFVNVLSFPDMSLVIFCWCLVVCDVTVLWEKCTVVTSFDWPSCDWLTFLLTIRVFWNVDFISYLSCLLPSTTLLSSDQECPAPSSVPTAILVSKRCKLASTFEVVRIFKSQWVADYFPTTGTQRRVKLYLRIVHTIQESFRQPVRIHLS